MLNSFVRSPFINLLCGLILLLTSGHEVWNTIEEFTIGAHHGVLFFSIVQILKTLPEILQATKEIDVSVNQHNK